MKKRLLFIALIGVVLMALSPSFSLALDDKVAKYKQPKDDKLIGVINEAGVDIEYVELETDYGKRDKEKDISPYSRVWKDNKSNKRFFETSQLPMVDADGQPINVGFIQVGESFYNETIGGSLNNVFYAEINGTAVTLTAKSDQPNVGLLLAP